MNKRAAPYAGAVLLIAVSFAFYAVQFRGPSRWKADEHDPADYRMTAEYFWNAPISPDTYYRIYHGGWGDYLRTMPFRGIGLGTAYLAAGWLRVGHVPITDPDVRAAGVMLSAFEKLLLAGALLLLFHVTKRAWGSTAAFAALALTAFPPHFWRMCDDFLAEPAERIIFLVALACAIAMGSSEAIVPLAMAIAALFLFAAHVKVQWWVGSVLLLPALLVTFHRHHLPKRASVAITAAVVAIPISVMAVNWIGWRTTSLSSGISIHLNLKFNGDVLRAYDASLAGRDRRPPFTDPSRPRLEWWNIYVGPPATRADYEDFDRFARAYVRAHPWAAMTAFADGLLEASTMPAVQVERDAFVRLAPLPEPWRLLEKILDCMVWAGLIIGLRVASTRIACALALVLWVVPALGNIVSIYDFRYHMPMAGIGAVAACGVAAHFLGLRRAGLGQRVRPRAVTADAH